MSLIGALNIGKSALVAHQAAIQVTSNNVANASNSDYTRQTASIKSRPDQRLRPGTWVGTGVRLDNIQRQIDDALEGRLRGSMSDSQAAQTSEQWFNRLEGVFQAMGDGNLSSQMSAFFNSWSDLANKPQDMSLRQVVLQAGQSLASSLQTISGDFAGVKTDLGKRLTALTTQANDLGDQVADLNRQIATAEGASGGSANALRDQRDAVLKKMAELLDIKVQDTGDGMVTVMVGAQPVVMGDTNRGIHLKDNLSGDAGTYFLATGDNNQTLTVTSGQIGALLSLQGQSGDVLRQFDALAGSLIYEVNKLHSSGQGLSGFTQITAGNKVIDTNVPLNSAATGLSNPPVNGSFVVHVKQKATGLVTSTLVQVDLDGLNGNDTTLESLKNTLGSVSGLSASISNGKLGIKTGSDDVEVTFSQDSSGVLASLGINCFFGGTKAEDITISPQIISNPEFMAAASNGQPADNQTARAIAQLELSALKGLNGGNLKDKYQAIINMVASSAASAKTEVAAAAAVHETLSAQREALSGVSLDEEAINLMREQRAFQGAARVISAVDEMTRTLLQMV